MDEVKDYPPYLDYPKPHNAKTNADRIRAMSDEELAKILGDKCICPPASECEKLCGDCDVCWMEWLRHPAEKAINQDHNQGKENDRGIY